MTDVSPTGVSTLICHWKGTHQRLHYPPSNQTVPSLSSHQDILLTTASTLASTLTPRIRIPDLVNHQTHLWTQDFLSPSNRDSSALSNHDLLRWLRLSMKLKIHSLKMIVFLTESSVEEPIGSSPLKIEMSLDKAKLGPKDTGRLKETGGHTYNGLKWVYISSRSWRWIIKVRPLTIVNEMDEQFLSSDSSESQKSKKIYSLRKFS